MSPSESTELDAFDAIRGRADDLRRALARVIVGQRDAVDTLLIALLCRGHVLLIGVPGLAKTLLVRTLADAVDLRFSRIQFTPDMMPADVLGTELIQEDPHTGRRSMRFVPGPIFAQLILADEINRTPPRTQAALLEAMAERQVTVAGQTRSLEEPFVVVATQNPIEQEGTYPLPEAQLDRFMLSLWMDYPPRADERQIAATPAAPATSTDAPSEIRTPKSEISNHNFPSLADITRIAQMPLSAHVVDYAVTLARATRPADVEAPRLTRDYVAWGAGPRAAQAMLHAARAVAALAGRPTPAIEDVRHVAMRVLRHRVLVNYAGAGEGVEPQQIVDRLLETIAEPGA
ncbi:MAG: AAA family ATPase [Phycisphaeraceae bacterium]